MTRSKTTSKDTCSCSAPQMTRALRAAASWTAADMSVVFFGKYCDYCKLLWRLSQFFQFWLFTILLFYFIAPLFQRWIFYFASYSHILMSEWENRVLLSLASVLLHRSPSSCDEGLLFPHQILVDGLIFRDCWPLELSLNPFLLRFHCLPSRAFTPLLWWASRKPPATSPSTVSPAEWVKNSVNINGLFAATNEHVFILIILQRILSYRHTPLFLPWTQVTTHRCSACPVIAYSTVSLQWRLVAVWLRSFPRFLVSSSARHYHGENIREAFRCSVTSNQQFNNRMLLFWGDWGGDHPVKNEALTISEKPGQWSLLFLRVSATFLC